MSSGILVSVDGWDSCSLDVTIGAGNDTWTTTTKIADIYDISIEQWIWLHDSGRPWYGSATFVSTEQVLTPWLGMKWEASTTCTWAPNAALQALLDWPSSGQTSTAIYSQTGVPSSCDCLIDVGDWAPRVVGTGGISRAGSFVRDSQAYALRSPQIEAVCTEEQLAALGEALRDASDPRWAHVVRPNGPAADPWVKIYPGRIEQSRSGDELYRVTFEAVA